jgi:hypothetical protein
MTLIIARRNLGGKEGWKKGKRKLIVIIINIIEP